MKNKKRTLYIVLTFIVVILLFFVLIRIASLVNMTQSDTDYEKLELNIKNYDIDYYTVYDKSFKVYKINNYYKGDSIDKIEKEIRNNDAWTRNKFYEYIMMKFYEKTDRKRTEIDRENLYYYHKGLFMRLWILKMQKYII